MVDILELRPVADSDLEQLETWLNKDYILKWYKDADEWLDEVKNRNGEFKLINHFIVLKDREPIGFCQYYDCFNAKEEWYEVSHPKQIFSIDYLIGEEKYIGKGLGKEIIKTLVNKIQSLYTDVIIIVQPDNDNVASCRSLLANGFFYNADKEYYILK